VRHALDPIIVEDECGCRLEVGQEGLMGITFLVDCQSLCEDIRHHHAQGASAQLCCLNVFQCKHVVYAHMLYGSHNVRIRRNASWVLNTWLCWISLAWVVQALLSQMCATMGRQRSMCCMLDMLLPCESHKCITHSYKRKLIRTFV
jgi:hypothetical protein